MKRKKQYMAILLLFINIIMLTVAVIPHHHHTSGTICMKQDVATDDEEEPCTHHHPHNDLCCNDGCITRFCSPVPPSPTSCRPEYVFCVTLYTEEILARLWRPREKKATNKFTYQETLPDTEVYGRGTLRAPPYRVGA